jgi:hypothetical protein
MITLKINYVLSKFFMKNVEVIKSDIRGYNH